MMRTALPSAAFVLLSALAALAEPMPPVPMLDQMVRSDHLVFEVVLGQVTLTGSGMGGRNSSSTGRDRSETLQMRVTPNESQLNYQLNLPTETFSVLVTGEQAVQMRRSPKGNAPIAVTYVQKPGHHVLLSVGSDDTLQTIEAPTLWHLLLAAPELCRDHLLPMLHTLGPQWDLEQAAAAIEKGLLRGEPATARAERDRWSELVGQLADDSFARREAADRELRAAGSAAVRFLRHLDFSSLGPEQQYRIRRMIDSASSAEGDTAVEVTGWLSADVQVWLILAGRGDVATRETAAARLTELLSEPIAFDPRAGEADRAAQLDTLRARLR